MCRGLKIAHSEGGLDSLGWKNNGNLSRLFLASAQSLCTAVCVGVYFLQRAVISVDSGTP